MEAVTRLSQKEDCCKAALTTSSLPILLAKLGSTSCLCFLSWWDGAEGPVGRSGDTHCCCFSGVFVGIGCALSWV